jgi:hypothetical protein
MVDTVEKIRELEKKLDELYDVLLAIKLKLETYRKILKSIREVILRTEYIWKSDMKRLKSFLIDM